jgi:hypothetical protein
MSKFYQYIHRLNSVVYEQKESISGLILMPRQNKQCRSCTGTIFTHKRPNYCFINDVVLYYKYETEYSLLLLRMSSILSYSVACQSRFGAAWHSPQYTEWC